MENGEIYKMELDGKIVGKFGRAGKLLKEFGSLERVRLRHRGCVLAHGGHHVHGVPSS